MDKLIIEKVKDQPNRKIWKIDVSNLSEEEADAFINQLKCKIKDIEYKHQSSFKRFLNKIFGWIGGYQ